MNILIKILFCFIIISQITTAQTTYRFFVNNINLPIRNNGVLADVNILPNGTLGRYDGVGFLFSSGFMMGGLDNNIPWANGVATASLVADYLPGPVGSSEDDPGNRFYIVKSSDPPFGKSWQDWKNAVELGADFYDGDGDGIYNPVDRNLNGTWDPSEDMPLIIGDETVWFVYNDSVPDSLRRWQSEPKQIEIAQTLFASNKPGFENIIFLRYKITNKSQNSLDSVYFGFWADPDIGSNYTDDLAGCDSLLNSGYAYKTGDDGEFGINPPGFFLLMIRIQPQPDFQEILC